MVAVAAAPTTPSSSSTGSTAMAFAAPQHGAQLLLLHEQRCDCQQVAGRAGGTVHCPSCAAVAGAAGVVAVAAADRGNGLDGDAVDRMRTVLGSYLRQELSAAACLVELDRVVAWWHRGGGGGGGGVEAANVARAEPRTPRPAASGPLLSAAGRVPTGSSSNSSGGGGSPAPVPSPAAAAAHWPAQQQGGQQQHQQQHQLRAAGDALRRAGLHHGISAEGAGAGVPEPGADDNWLAFLEDADDAC